MAEQNRGVVLETQKSTVTVLTPQGEFINIPWFKLPYPEIGSEVKFAQPMEKRAFFKDNRFMAIAACLMIMFLSMTLWAGIILPSSQQVVAYVNIDINPSIELGLNKQGKVVQAIGLNQDGELLLQKLELKNLTANKAVEIITNAAVEGNYLHADKENNVFITVSDSQKVPDRVINLEQKVSAQLTANKLSGNTQVIEVSGDLHDKAKELGVSPGKYVVLLEAVEEGLDLTLEDIKGNSITSAIKMAGGVPGQIISKAQHDKKDYQDLERRTEVKRKSIEETHKNRGNKDQNEKEDRDLNNKDNDSNNGIIHSDDKRNPSNDNKKESEDKKIDSGTDKNNKGIKQDSEKSEVTKDKIVERKTEDKKDGVEQKVTEQKEKEKRGYWSEKLGKWWNRR